MSNLAKVNKIVMMALLLGQAAAFVGYILQITISQGNTTFDLFTAFSIPAVLAVVILCVYKKDKGSRAIRNLCFASIMIFLTTILFLRHNPFFYVTGFPLFITFGFYNDYKFARFGAAMLLSVNVLAIAYYALTIPGYLTNDISIPLLQICTHIFFLLTMPYSVKYVHDEHQRSVIQEHKRAEEMAVMLEQLNIAHENVKRANEYKSRFLAAMSHEMRTPMNAIIGISDIELDKNGLSSETKDAFERISNSGKTLLGIINDILDLSKVETGKLELLPVKYDTPSLINDTVRLNVMRIGSKPLEFIIKVSETLPAYLIGDELRIKQILNNILSNAIKYTEQGSVSFEIDFRPDEKGVMLIFTVRDTGQGMSEEQLAAIYDEYSMFNRAANREKEGTGLGMGITKGLVELMDGKITAESAVGVGSTFVVSLLQQSAGADVLGREMAEKLQNFSFTPNMQRAKLVREYMPYGSVLVVDDVDANIFVARGLLKPYGLTVDSAASGYEALDKIRAGASYDIIFMDHMMPGMDGIETTKLLREEGYGRAIIALTANAVSGMKEMFRENGFDGFVPKPIDLRQLNHVLNSLIRDKYPPAVAEAARRQKEGGGNAAVDAADTADTAPAAPDDEPLSRLRAVGGLEVDAALEAMGGLEDVYIGSAKLTARLLPERVVKMDGFVDSDWKAFTIEVHGLKSTLKNIGAAALGNMAAQLERAALEEDLSYCQTHYPAFRAGLTELCASLTQALETAAAGPKKTADRAALMQALDAAKVAMEAFDQNAAIELLSPHTAYSYGAETDGLLREIMDALAVFDCAAALSRLDCITE